MKLRRELRKQLAMEFSNIRPDILKVIVGVVTEGMDKKSQNQIFFDIFDEDASSVPDLEERHQMIYETLLKCAREICNDSHEINEIRGIIQRALEKVNGKKIVGAETNTTSMLQMGQHCSIFRTDASSFYEPATSTVEKENVGEKRR